MMAFLNKLTWKCLVLVTRKVPGNTIHAECQVSSPAVVSRWNML